MNPHLPPRVRTPLLRALAILVAAPALLSAGPARAEGNANATVQALYDKALLLLEQKDYDAACPALEDVVRRAPDGNGAKLTLAQCYEESGHLATALAAYEAAETAATEARQIERKIKAHIHVEALRPKVARLAILVDEPARTVPDLSVQCDGVPISVMRWTVPFPVDKGRHMITATAPGKLRWEKMIEVTDDGTTTTATVDGLSDDPSAGAHKKEPPPSPPLGARRVAGIFVGLGGLVGIAAGAGLGVMAISKKNESDRGHCNALNRCDSTGLDLRASGRVAGNASTAMFILGGVALATGVTLLALPSRPSRVTVTASIGPGSLDVHGVW